jgi:oxygen-independent coproporphyrinogen-3 oxidase
MNNQNSQQLNSSPSAALPTAAYIHIPFCKSKCFYCDFNSYPGQEGLRAEFVDALVKEINAAIDSKNPLETVYFGGGTPTLLSAEHLLRILEAIRAKFGISPDAEVTIEANPGTVTPETLAALRNGGFNRLRIGVQSFDDQTLQILGRIHSAKEAQRAFLEARKANYGNISIDLMYALPDQTISNWESTLQKALELSPEHISLYELSIEEGTHFGNLRSRCMIQLPDEDLQLEMYQMAIDRLTSAGFEHYEVSNFARPGRRSRHNQVYWRNEPYYGFGAGATGYVQGIRYTNTATPRDYIDQVNASGRAVATEESLTGRESMGETIMLGLRMLDGVDTFAFEHR